MAVEHSSGDSPSTCLESDNKCSQCWRVGRRASSLARGHFLPMIKDLRRCSSKSFNRRLGKLPMEARNRVLHRVTSSATNIEEELLEKFGYHQTIPHMICGVWPLDEESQGIAQACIQQYEAEDHKKSHRVSIRMLDKGSYLGRRIRLAAQGEGFSLELEFGLKAMNLAPTTEQYLEAVHAESKAFKVGRRGNCSYQVLSVKVRSGQTMLSLNRWDAILFGAEMWGSLNLAKEILTQSRLPKTFCDFATPADLLQALHFNHDRQLFSHCHDVSKVVDHWDASSSLPKAFISQDEKLALQCLTNRLCDCIVSLPPFADSELAVQDQLNLVVADNIVHGAIVAARDETTVEEQLVTAEVQLHTFYKVVNADLSGRYYHNDKDFHTCSTMCAVRFSLECADPTGLWTLRPRSVSVERTVFTKKADVKQKVYTCIYVYITYCIGLTCCSAYGKWAVHVCWARWSFGTAV